MQGQTDGMFVSTETHTNQHTMEHTNTLNWADAGRIRNHQLFILEKTTEDLGSKRQKKAVPTGIYPLFLA